MSYLSVNLNINTVSVLTLGSFYFLTQQPVWITNKGYLYRVMEGIHPGVFSVKQWDPAQLTIKPPH